MRSLSLIILMILLTYQLPLLLGSNAHANTIEKRKFPQSTPDQDGPDKDSYLYGCNQTTGTVVDAIMESQIYNSSVKYTIYLPPCYADSTATRFPVLYLLNGQTFDNHQWVDLGLAATADALINNHSIAPVLIVLPNDQDWRQPDESPFGQMLVEEMIPFIDRSYLTLSSKQYRAIGGLSRGASWALNLGLSEWRLFSRIGAHSLPVFTSDSSKIPGWLEKIPSDSIPQIYIDIGDQDPELNTARKVERTLTAFNIPHEWHMFTGSHEEDYWSRHLGKYLFWYACGWAVLYYN